MFWLSDGEEIMTLAFLVLIQYRSVVQYNNCSGSSKVVDLGTNRKRVYDVLLVINSD